MTAAIFYVKLVLVIMDFMILSEELGEGYWIQVLAFVSEDFNKCIQPKYFSYLLRSYFSTAGMNCQLFPVIVRERLGRDLCLDFPFNTVNMIWIGSVVLESLPLFISQFCSIFLMDGTRTVASLLWRLLYWLPFLICLP